MGGRRGQRGRGRAGTKDPAKVRRFLAAARAANPRPRRINPIFDRADPGGPPADDPRRPFDWEEQTR